MDKFQPFLEKYASDLTVKFSLPVAFNPEDQLKSPVASLIKNAGNLLNLEIETFNRDSSKRFGGTA